MGNHSDLLLQGLDSDTPRLRIGDGQIFQGRHEEHLGSILLFDERPAPSTAEQAPTDQVAKVLGLKCHTESKIVFTRAAMHPQ